MSVTDPTAPETPDEDLPPVPREVPPFYTGVVLWGVSGDLLLQQRDDIPGISSPGMIGTFGGGGHERETLLEAAVREVREETGLTLDPARLFLLNETEKRFRGPVVIPIHTFGYIDVPEDHLVITEGQLFRLDPARLEDTPKMTLSTRIACRKLLERFGPA